MTLSTVGHSNRSLESLVELLKAHGINWIADVRRFPASRRHPQFNRAALEEGLAREGIGYTHFPSLGGRRSPKPDSVNTAWRVEGFRGYADHMATEEFRESIASLLALVANHRVAVMCAEALWWRCHRALIADYCKFHGHRVAHIGSRRQPEDHPYTSAARVVNGELIYHADPAQEEWDWGYPNR